MLDIESLLEKYEEALVTRDFEVGIVREAVVQALGGGK